MRIVEVGAEGASSDDVARLVHQLAIDADAEGYRQIVFRRLLFEVGRNGKSANGAVVVHLAPHPGWLAPVIRAIVVKLDTSLLDDLFIQISRVTRCNQHDGSHGGGSKQQTLAHNIQNSNVHYENCMISGGHVITSIGCQIWTTEPEAAWRAFVARIALGPHVRNASA